MPSTLLQAREVVDASARSCWQYSQDASPIAPAVTCRGTVQAATPGSSTPTVHSYAQRATVYDVMLAGAASFISPSAVVHCQHTEVVARHDGRTPTLAGDAMRVCARSL